MHSEIVLPGGLAKDQPQTVQISCNICAFVKHMKKKKKKIICRNEHNITYYALSTMLISLSTGCGKIKYPSIFCGFLSNRVEFQGKILHTYLVIICAFK